MEPMRMIRLCRNKGESKIFQKGVQILTINCVTPTLLHYESANTIVFQHLLTIFTNYRELFSCVSHSYLRYNCFVIEYNFNQ